jgi:hypothetical protein
MNDLMATLQQILGSFQHTYIVLDALDECTERDGLLKLINDIVGWKLGSLHILATSRKERDIEDSLECLVPLRINIQSTLVDSDIESYLQVQLGDGSKFKKWPIKVREEIKTALVEGAQGM